VDHFRAQLAEPVRATASQMTSVTTAGLNKWINSVEVVVVSFEDLAEGWP